MIHNKTCNKPYYKYDKSDIAQPNHEFSFVKSFFGFDIFNRIFSP